MSFVVPDIIDNPEGWGPSVLPEKYLQIPYAPFNKGDKLGKISDWSGITGHRNYNARAWRQVSGVNTAFGYQLETEEDASVGGFQTQRKTTTTSTSSNTKKNQPYTKKSTSNTSGSYSSNNTKGGYVKRTNYRPNRTRQSSIEIKPDWKEITQFSFIELNKMNLPESSYTNLAAAKKDPLNVTLIEPEDLKFCGFTEFFDKNYDRITTKSEKPLSRFDDRTYFKVATSDDPIIRDFTAKRAANVFATDSVLAAIMASSRSIHSWDILINKVGGLFFLEKRNSSDFENLTVNETSSDAPTDDGSINSVSSLSEEATNINQNFFQQVLTKGKKLSFPDANPFQTSSDELVAPVLYRYRKWKLDNEFTLVARCELEGVTGTKQDPKYLTIKALNQYDPNISKMDWRQKLDSQRGAILAMELKNNNNKMTRWIAKALLSGSDQLKLGYVSRTNPKERFSHSIIGIETFKPKEIAKMINLNESNMWGIILHILKSLSKQEDGRYILVKDPTKQTLRLWQVPEDANLGDDIDIEDEDASTTEEAASTVTNEEEPGEEDTVTLQHKYL